MKKKLVETLRQIETLLRECGWDDRASWLAKRRNIIEHTSYRNDKFHDVLTELKSIIAGMGSLSDVPMYPKEGSSITAKEAFARHWDLVQTLDETLAAMLKTTVSAETRASRRGAKKVRA
ncbi:MAG: hypothetical protein JO093_14100 [Acidobacteria bacterium]|nr:hypothetical protein [Acidobacteriota bacterium]MBV9186748.1 hypothetical protein [Acidobacteriota bacterium]